MSDVEERVRRYVSAVITNGDAERISTVRRFETGERHAVFAVACVDSAGTTTDVVVRVSLGDDVAERAQATREARVLEVLRGIGAPRLRDFQVEGPWFDAPSMCMDRVPGEHRELQTVAPDGVERLGAVVGWLHGQPTAELGPSFPDVDAVAYIEGRLAQVVAYLPAVRDPLPTAMQRRIDDGVRAVRAARPTGTSAARDRLALLHADVATDNVIWSPEPVLIDWEYARIGDPADEIAYAFTQNALTERQRVAFWRGYRVSAGSDAAVERALARVAWWEPVTLLGSALWWVERWSRAVDAEDDGRVDATAPKPAPYYLDHARQRLDRFEELLAAS